MNEIDKKVQEAKLNLTRLRNHQLNPHWRRSIAAKALRIALEKWPDIADILKARLGRDWVTVSNDGTVSLSPAAKIDHADFTGLQDACIDSSLDVVLSRDLSFSFNGIPCSLSILFWHPLSKDDEMTLRSINVIRSEVEQASLRTVVSCEI